jgi:HEPN domain-containing protein
MRQHEQALLFAKKAAEDAALLGEVLASSKVSNEIFGFHAQQAAEKLLKALLSESGVPFPRTHNLRLLMDLLADAGHPLPASFSDLDTLTPYGTLFRYEDSPANIPLDRKTAFDMVSTFYAFVEKKIGTR